MATLVAAPPNEIIWDLANSVVASRALHAMADLGVADHIDDTPVPVEELARRCGADADALARVLRLLSSHGIFELSDAGCCAHSDASRLLRTDHPMSMRAFARLNGLPGVWAALGAFEHSLRTGAPSWLAVDPRGFFPYLQGHPDEAEVFEQAMTAKARFDISTIVEAYDFRRFRTVVDVGGGRGHLLRAVLTAAPDADGVLFELPDVARGLDIATPRLRVQAGDFFEDPLPAADLYILMEVIHDWRDEQATRILQAVRAAAAPGATVIVVEDIAPDDDVDRRSQTLDVVMLAVTGGRERSARQHAGLFRAAGIRMTRVVATAGPMRIVEGFAV
jgi:hypothetical protein